MRPEYTLTDALGWTRPKDGQPDRWRAEKNVAGVRYRGRVFATPREAAQDWLRVYRTKPTTPTGTVRQYIEEVYWPARAEGTKPSTARTYQTHHRLICQYLGGLSLADLTATQLQGFANKLAAAGYSLRYRAQVRNRLQHVLAAARADRRLAHPAAGLEDTVAWKVDGHTTVKVPLEALPTFDMTDAILAALPPRLRLAVHLARWTGARVAEVCGLTMDRVDFDRQLITFDRQLYEGPLQLVPVKTGHTYEAIAPPELLELILDHRNRYGRVHYLPEAAHAQIRGADLLLVGQRLGPVAPRELSKQFRKACRQAGVSDRVTFHKYRHAVTSLLVNHGELNVQEVAELMNRKNLQVLNAYVHTDDRGSLQARARLILTPPSPPNLPLTGSEG